MYSITLGAQLEGISSSKAGDTYRVRHEISNTQIIVQKGANLCATHIVPYLLEIVSSCFNSAVERGCAYLMNNVDILSPTLL
jgi:hypothetical protein